jgi:hypothetical protein
MIKPKCFNKVARVLLKAKGPSLYGHAGLFIVPPRGNIFQLPTFVSVDLV